MRIMEIKEDNDGDGDEGDYDGMSFDNDNDRDDGGNSQSRIQEGAVGPLPPNGNTSYRENLC